MNLVKEAQNIRYNGADEQEDRTFDSKRSSNCENTQHT